MLRVQKTGKMIQSSSYIRNIRCVVGSYKPKPVNPSLHGPVPDSLRLLMRPPLPPENNFDLGCKSSSISLPNHCAHSFAEFVDLGIEDTPMDI